MAIDINNIILGNNPPYAPYFNNTWPLFDRNLLSPRISVLDNSPQPIENLGINKANPSYIIPYYDDYNEAYDFIPRGYNPRTDMEGWSNNKTWGLSDSAWEKTNRGLGLVGNAVSQYVDYKPGAALSAIGQGVSTFNPIAGSIIQGLGIGGSLLLGSKEDKEKTGKWEATNKEMLNFTSNVGDNDSMMQKIQSQPRAITYNNIGWQGPLSSTLDDKMRALNRDTIKGIGNVQSQLTNNILTIQNDTAQKLRKDYVNAKNGGYLGSFNLPSYVSGNGILNINSSGVLSPFGNRFSKGGAIDAILTSNGSKWSDGLRHINVGGSHESNPNGGVLQGIDAQGVPNFVQEGEVIWDDYNQDAPYVFSNELKTPRGLRQKYNLRKNKGTSFADDIMEIEKRYADFKNDPITKRAMDNILTEFRDSQEEVRIKKEQRRQAKELENILNQQYMEQNQPYLNPSLLNTEMMGNQEEQPVASFEKGGKMGKRLRRVNKRLAKSMRKANSYFNPTDVITDYTPAVTYVGPSREPLVGFHRPELPYEYGGGNFGGAGAGNREVNSVLPGKDLQWDFLPVGYTQRTFNDAYREARERGDKTFEFNGGLYTTDYDSNVPNWKELGDSRVESGIGIAPIPHYNNGGKIKVNRYDDGSFLNTNPYYDAVTNTYSTDYYNALPDIINSIATNNTKSDWLKGFNRTIPELNIDLGKDKDNKPYTWQDMSKLKAGDDAYDRQFKYITSSDFAKSPLGLTAANIYANKQLADYGLKPTSNNLKYFFDLSDEDKESIKKQIGTKTAVNDLAQWIAARKPNGEDTTDNAFEYEQYANDKIPISKLADLRYIPAFGAGLSVFSDLMGWTNKADMSGPDMIAAATQRIPDVRFSPITGYMPNNYLDTQYYLNQLYANSAQGRRFLQNLSNGNAAALRAGIVGSDYNMNNKLGEALIQALNYNNARRDAKAQHDLKIDIFNAEQQAKASQLNNTNAITRAQAVRDYVAARDAVLGRRDTNVNLNLTNLFNSLGNIGREEFQRNMINSNNAMYYTISSKGDIMYKPGFFNLPPEYRWMVQQKAYEDSKTKKGNSKKSE